MSQRVWATLVLLGLPHLVAAQFVPTLLQNRSYWGDGKSEIDFYQAEFPRDGEQHSSEVLITLTPLFVLPDTMAPAQDPKQPGVIPAIRMNELATIPRGLMNEPGRCPSCRASRRSSQAGGVYGSSYGGGYGGGEREMFTAVCSNCGKEARVPFQPRTDRPVYCSDCFQQVRGATSYR